MTMISEPNTAVVQWNKMAGVGGVGGVAERV